MCEGAVLVARARALDDMNVVINLKHKLNSE